MFLFQITISNLLLLVPSTLWCQMGSGLYLWEPPESLDLYTRPGYGWWYRSDRTSRCWSVLHAGMWWWCRCVYLDRILKAWSVSFLEMGSPVETFCLTEPSDPRWRLCWTPGIVSNPDALQCCYTLLLCNLCRDLSVLKGDLYQMDSSGSACCYSPICWLISTVKMSPGWEQLKVTLVGWGSVSLSSKLQVWEGPSSLHTLQSRPCPAFLLKITLVPESGVTSILWHSAKKKKGINK